MYNTSFFLSVFSYNLDDKEDERSFAEINNVFPISMVLISDSVPARRLKTCTSAYKIEMSIIISRLNRI